MNLDDLKSAWKTANEQQLVEQQVSAEEVRAIVQTRSRSALARINRNIVGEAIAVVVLGVAALAYLGISSGNNIVEISTTLLYIGASLVFYRYKYRALNSNEITADSLSTSLRQLVKRMQGFLRIYDYMIVIGVPLAAVLGLWYGWTRQPLPIAPSDAALWKIIVLTCVVAVLFIGCWIWLSRWYIKRVYGKHFAELTACLHELVENA
jgi:hypothetical protein